MEWETAYHWPTQSTVDVNFVLRRREEGRLEAGDCWCHESCYTNSPRTGCKLFPRKASADGRSAHFWKGPGSFTKIDDCKFELLRKSQNESQRYAQFYHDMRQWLDTEEASNLLSMLEYHESKNSRYSDFLINHELSDKITWESTEVLIIHKNRRRLPDSRNFVIIDLGQWTIEQISDFDEFGKRKILEEFNQISKRLEQEARHFLHEEKQRQRRIAEQNEYERVYNLPENIRAREVEKRKKYEKEKQNHLSYYSSRLAGPWRAPGFQGFRQQDRYHMDDVATYFNKYLPETKLDYESRPNFFEHYRKNRICIVDKENCSDAEPCIDCVYLSQGKVNRKIKFESDEIMRCSSSKVPIDGLPYILYKIDPEDPLQINTHCSLCDEKLDSYSLNFSKINSRCLNHEKNKYETSHERFRLFTRIERALLESIGIPEPISGDFDGFEKLDYRNPARRRAWGQEGEGIHWRIDRILDYDPTREIDYPKCYYDELYDD